MPPHSLEEVLVIVSNSLRIQICVVLGPALFLLIAFFGERLSGRIDTGGTLGPLMEILRDTVLRRYMLSAIAAWASFWALAVRLYLRERRRLYWM